MMSTISSVLHKPLFSGHADKLIASSGLPESIQALIRSIVRRSRLWRSEQADVARELIDHFSDGLAAGRTADQLIADFGDPAKSTKLIRAGKKRARPLWWQFQRRTGHVLLAFLGLLVLAYIVQAIRFYTGSPTISRNYLAELNAPIVATPADQRGYPVFLQAIQTLEPVPDDVSGIGAIPSGANIGSFSFAAAAPGEDRWPQMAGYVSRNAEGLALLRKSAGFPHFGYVASNITDPAYSQAMLHHRVPLPEEEQQIENPNLIGVLLPYLGSIRQAAMLLNADAFVAAEASDFRRVESDLVAMIGFAGHAREFPVLIGDLVAMAILDRAGMTLTQIIEAHPGVMEPERLRTLAKAFASYPRDGGAIVRFDAERAIWSDAAQRLYTDDGHGNGRITAEGIRQLLEFTSLAGPNKMEPMTGPLSPIAASIIADRKSMTEKYNLYTDRTQALVDVPLWKRSDAAIDADVEHLLHSKFKRIRYFPLSLLLPALSQATVNGEHSLQRRDAVLTAIAIELYRYDNASPPATLDELIPVYMPSAPFDRFDGTPIKYRRTSSALGYTLYSVGTDLDDDAGTPPPKDATRASMWRPRDLVQRLKAEGVSDRELPDGDWILVPAPTDN